MSGTGEPRPTTLVDGLFGPVREAPVRWIAGLVLVLALGVSGLFGGLDDVGAKEADAVGVGAVSDGKPWKLTVKAGRIVGDLPPLDLTDPGNRWLAVIVLVEVTAEESRGDLADAVTIEGATTLSKTGKASEILYLRDTRTVNQVHPGMPEEVVFFWEQAGAEPVPTTVTAVLWGKTLRPLSWDGQAVWPDDGTPQWTDPAITAKVEVPMTDRRDASSASPSPSPSSPRPSAGAPSGSPSAGRPSSAPPSRSATPGRTASPTPSRSR